MWECLDFERKKLVSDLQVDKDGALCAPKAKSREVPMAVDLAAALGALEK
jgi:hypothetical protein